MLRGIRSMASFRSSTSARVPFIVNCGMRRATMLSFSPPRALGIRSLSTLRVGVIGVVVSPLLRSRWDCGTSACASIATLPAEPLAAAAAPPPPPPPPPRSLIAQWAAAAIRLLASVRRIVYLCLLFTPLLVTWPLCGAGRRRRLWWRYCVFAAESAGALVIKLAQWASSRPDLFGEDVCGHFTHLQDKTAPHSWRATLAALDASLGPGWSERLALEREPIGSGCIAQVHRGWLHAEGSPPRQVAVKVVHPGVREVIAQDIGMLQGLGEALQKLPRLRWLNPKGMVDEFSKMLLMQLDLRVEAENLLTFRNNFAGHAELDILFPEPLPPYVCADVLVESYIEGIPFLKWAAEVADAKVCNQGIDAFIKMLFEDNFTHGDLHPGNIFVTTEGKLAFLDAGIAIRYTESDHNHLVEVLSCFLRYDGCAGAKLMADQSEDQESLFDIDGFCNKIEAMVLWQRDTPTFFDQIGPCIATICNAACDHHVKLRSGFVAIALSVKVVEGAVVQADPLAVVAPRAKAVIVREHARRKGRAMLNRSLITGELLNSSGDSFEKRLAEAKSAPTN